MTTIILLKCKEGILLASDSQVTSGNLKLPEIFDKIQVLDNNLIACCGSVGLCQHTLNRASKNLRIGKIEAEAESLEIGIKELAREISNINFYMPLEYKKFQSAGFLLAGYDDGEFLGYSVGEDGSKIPINHYYADGSGQQFALSLLAKDFNPNLTMEEAIKKVHSILEQIQGHDIYTDGLVKIYTLQIVNDELKLQKFVNFKKEEEAQPDGKT